MQVEDLGEITGDVVLWGGAVSNLQATEALIGVVGTRASVCTGDLVAYCGRPAETVAAVRGTGWPVVAGNCERQVAAGAEDCGCGFGDGTACDRMAGPWYAHALSEVDAEARAWMADLPDAALFRHAGRRYAVIHGGWSAINRFLWPSDPDAAFAGEIALIEAALGQIDGIVAGHAGIAFERRVGRVAWINPGAIGLPPHDGRAGGRYAVLSDDGARIERLLYDHASACADMETAGLTQGYHETLTSGLWPSEDVLPTALRR